MQPYGVNQLRKMFLEFFESKDHLALKSFSLVPHNDKSLLLINSGMAPLKFGNGAFKTIFYRTGDPAEEACHDLSEMYPYGRY